MRNGLIINRCPRTAVANFFSCFFSSNLSKRKKNYSWKIVSRIFWFLTDQWHSFGSLNIWEIRIVMYYRRANSTLSNFTVFRYKNVFLKISQFLCPYIWIREKIHIQYLLHTVWKSKSFIIYRVEDEDKYVDFLLHVDSYIKW